MGHKSITGGVIPAGLSRIRFDFTVDGHRFRPTLPWIPSETNLQRARTHLARIKAHCGRYILFFRRVSTVSWSTETASSPSTSNVRTNIR